MRIGSRWGLSFAAIAVAILALAVVTARPALADSEGHFDKTLTVTGPVDLDVQTGSGDITVHPGDAGHVEIHATIRASGRRLTGDIEARIKQIEDNPPVQQEGNSIHIGGGDHSLFENISISYEIKTPKETHLRSKSGSGDEDVEGIAGPVDAASGSGSLKVHDIGDEVHATTGSGDVDIENAHGKARVEFRKRIDPRDRYCGFAFGFDGKRLGEAGADGRRRCGSEHRVRRSGVKSREGCGARFDRKRKYPRRRRACGTLAIACGLGRRDGEIAGGGFV